MFFFQQNYLTRAAYQKEGSEGQHLYIGTPKVNSTNVKTRPLIYWSATKGTCGRQTFLNTHPKIMLCY